MTPRLIQLGTGKNKIHIALARRGWSVVGTHNKVVANLPTMMQCIVRCRSMGIDTSHQQVVS